MANRLLTERELRNGYLEILKRGLPECGIEGLSDEEAEAIDRAFPLESEMQSVKQA